MLGKYETFSTPLEIANLLTESSYIKKQNKQVREKFTEDILKFLRSNKFIEKRYSKFGISNAKSPYMHLSDVF